MELTSNELSELVIRKSDDQELSGGGMALETLNILLVLYEPKKVEAVTKEAGYDLEVVREKIISMIKDGMVEVVDGRSKILETGFIKRLKTELTKSLGPLAAILIEDVADELGYEINFFPSSQANALIGLLIEEIHSEDQAAEFKRKVTAELQLHQKE